MPTAYPSANDTFAAPTSPATTTLSSAGDSSRNHTQSHQDLGDAIVALQKNAALLSHDHSNTEARPTSKLLQANTHESVDTDATTSSIHHTIGTGSKQAAAGNHTHQEISDLRTADFGGSNRLKTYRARAQYSGNSNASLPVGTDWPAAGGWTSDSSVDSGDSMFGVSSDTSAVYLSAPVAGNYLLTWQIRLISGGAGQYLNACFLKNSTASNTRAAAIQALSETNTPNSGNGITLNGAKTIRLAAGDRIFNTIAGLTGGNYQLVNNQLPNACSFWELTWVGA